GFLLPQFGQNRINALNRLLQLKQLIHPSAIFIIYRFDFLYWLCNCSYLLVVLCFLLLRQLEKMISTSTNTSRVCNVKSQCRSVDKSLLFLLLSLPPRRVISIRLSILRRTSLSII